MATEEIKHPDWCLRGDNCKHDKDGEVTHTHVVGAVDDDIKVVIERTDTAEDGKTKRGSTRAYWYVGDRKLTLSQGRRLNHLLGRASGFNGNGSSTLGGVS